MQFIDKDMIQQAFITLGEKLEKNGLICRICVYDGSAILFISKIAKMPAQIDYRIIELKSIKTKLNDDFLINKFRNILLDITQELNLEENWMNDGVKCFISDNEILSDEMTFGNGWF